MGRRSAMPRLAAAILAVMGIGAVSACSTTVGPPVVDLTDSSALALSATPTPVATTAPIVVPTPSVEPTPLPTPLPAFVLDVDQPYVFRAERASQAGGSRHQIVVEQNGQVQTVMDWDCHRVHSVEDYDLDGLDEALVEFQAGCGGNCCPNRYQFIDVAEDGTLAVTEQSVGDWNEPEIERTVEGWRLTVEDPHAGFNTVLKHTTQTFTLANGRLVELERIEAVELPSIAEIRSEVERSAQLVYDLNGDGIDEIIECDYWARWGTFTRCKLLVLSEAGVAIEQLGGKRIGVLETTTNGWYDLVGDFDTIYRWDGAAYTLAA